MENETVLAGTAIIDAASDLRSRQSQRGHDITLTAFRGLEVSITYKRQQGQTVAFYRGRIHS